MAEIIQTLQPVAPDAPHLMMSQEDLEAELEVADLADGRLPHWYDELERPQPGKELGWEDEPGNGEIYPDPDPE